MWGFLSPAPPSGGWRHQGRDWWFNSNVLWKYFHSTERVLRPEPLTGGEQLPIRSEDQVRTSRPSYHHRRWQTESVHPLTCCDFLSVSLSFEPIGSYWRRSMGQSCPFVGDYFQRRIDPDTVLWWECVGCFHIWPYHVHIDTCTVTCEWADVTVWRRRGRWWWRYSRVTTGRAGVKKCETTAYFNETSGHFPAVFVPAEPGFFFLHQLHTIFKPSPSGFCVLMSPENKHSVVPEEM